VDRSFPSAFFYRAAFWSGVAVIVVPVTVGLAAPWVGHVSVPAFGSDALVQARGLEAAGDLPRAFEQYRRAARLQEGSAAYAFAFAQSLLKHGRLNEAETWFRAAARLDPALSGAHAGLGAVALDRSRLDDAALHFQRALELDPRNVSFHNELGIAHALRGRYQEAILAFEAATDLGGGEEVRGNLERARQDAVRAASGS
jgi:tetratricopeptide (TPR) repeat protein